MSVPVSVPVSVSVSVSVAGSWSLCYVVIVYSGWLELSMSVVRGGRVSLRTLEWDERLERTWID